MAATTTVPPLSQEPEILTIAQRLGEAERKRDALVEESNEIFRLTSAYAVHAAPSHASAADRLRAEDRRPDVDRGLRIVAAELDDLAREQRAVIAAVRARRWEARLPAMRTHAQEVERAAAPFAAALRALRADFDAAEADGVTVDKSLTLPTLFGTGDPAFTPQFDYVVAGLRDLLGLL